MRIACLQFNPELGRLSENIARANFLLEAESPQNIDLLVLPELAFTGTADLPCPCPSSQHIYLKIGYNYPSLSSIFPHLAPTASGPSTAWARATASRLNCIVTVGYPELCAPSHTSSKNTQDLSSPGGVIAYNSTVSVSPFGEILAHYRKTHLYYTDETWAQESPSGWLSTSLTFAPKTCPQRTIRANFGICRCSPADFFLIRHLSKTARRVTRVFAPLAYDLNFTLCTFVVGKKCFFSSLFFLLFFRA